MFHKNLRIFLSAEQLSASHEYIFDIYTEYWLH